MSAAATSGPFPDYPFEAKAFVHANGLRQNYVDEGPRDGEVVVMLHGNPSWSFYWRHLVLGLRDKYRCIVPDHIGMGLSDKPDDSKYTYTLQSRIDDLDALLQHLGVDGPVTLAVHDWGGMIGFGWALKHSHRVKRLVVLNTSSFPLPGAKRMPWRLRLGRDSKLGGWAIRRFNLFAGGAARFGIVFASGSGKAAVLRITSRRTRALLANAQPKPIMPPQSCTASVTGPVMPACCSRRSRSSMRDCSV